MCKVIFSCGIESTERKDGFVVDKAVLSAEMRSFSLWARKKMTSIDSAFDDFVDDCFIEQDPLCNVSSGRSLELVASKLISEIIEEEDELIAS